MLTGRVALVTGGGRGIGREVARLLAARGAAVAVLARSAEQVAEAAAEIRGLPVVADVSDPDDVRRAVKEVGSALGQVDVLVNNAGVVWPLGRFAETDADAWDRAVAINLLGAARLTRAVLPGMLQRGYGRMVAVTSGAAADAGMPSASAYSVAKAGLEMLVRNLAAELAGTGVTFNAVRPGVADTGMQDYMRSVPSDVVGQQFVERFHGLHRDGALIAPTVGARVVVALIASARTGEVLDVRSEKGRALLG